MKKKLKGFTLLELIVVMAIFSGIAVGALAMIRPAMQLFQKTSSQEGASADIDNISRYIQDNLRYADRVNVYYGYGETSVSDMLYKSINDKYTKLHKNGDNWEKQFYESNPINFFRDYYYSSAADYENEKLSVMEIDNEGKVKIYTYSLKDGSEALPVSKISDEYYNDYAFQITDWDFSPPDLTITMKIEYNGVTKDSSGNKTKLNQESKIGLTFLNIAQRSEFNVIEKTTNAFGEIIGVDESSDYTVNNDKTSSRPALAYKYFSPDPLPDADKMGSTYILYTVPEIIIP